MQQKHFYSSLYSSVSTGIIGRHKAKSHEHSLPYCKQASETVKAPAATIAVVGKKEVAEK
jgi:hypothetical protein